MSQVENKKHKGPEKGPEIWKKQKALQLDHSKQKKRWNKIREVTYQMLQGSEVQAKDFSFYL